MLLYPEECNLSLCRPALTPTRVSPLNNSPLTTVRDTTAQRRIEVRDVTEDGATAALPFRPLTSLFVYRLNIFRLKEFLPPFFSFRTRGYRGYALHPSRSSYSDHSVATSAQTDVNIAALRAKDPKSLTGPEKAVLAMAYNASSRNQSAYKDRSKPSNRR